MRPGWGVLVVGLGTVVVPFDSSVNVAFPHIIRGFALPIPAIQWVVIAYTLTYAALMLVFGRIGDMFGYRRIFLLGNATGALAFLLCSMATSYEALLGARVMQGIGAALALSCGPALATSLYPESERTRILGLYTMVFGIGGSLGPVLAGQLVEHWGWSAVFWFRAPIALSAFALAWFLPKGIVRGAARFDALGAVLMVLTVTLMLLALNQIRSVAVFLSLAAATLVAGTLFIRRQNSTPQPIIDLRYFRDRDFALVNAAHILLNLAGFSIMLLVPFYLDRIGGLSVPVGGMALAASPFGVMLSSPLAGRLAAFIAPKRLALSGTAAMAVAQVVIGTTGGDVNLPLLLGAMFLQGVGLGLFQVAYFDIATATIPKEDRGVAGSLVMMTRTVGVVTGATVLMLVFQSLRSTAIAQGTPDADAFLVGFQGAFRIAAALPVIVLLACLARGWARR